MELSQGNESFMLCEVQNANGPRILTAHEESYLGRFEIGDEVLDVRKFEPTSLGSSMFELSDKVFPVFVEDIRKRNMHNFGAPGGSPNALFNNISITEHQALT